VDTPRLDLNDDIESPCAMEVHPSCAAFVRPGSALRQSASKEDFLSLTHAASAPGVHELHVINFAADSTSTPIETQSVNRWSSVGS
jgi:hypothetical protein